MRNCQQFASFARKNVRAKLQESTAFGFNYPEPTKQAGISLLSSIDVGVTSVLNSSSNLNNDRVRE